MKLLDKWLSPLLFVVCLVIFIFGVCGVIEPIEAKLERSKCIKQITLNLPERAKRNLCK